MCVRRARVTLLSLTASTASLETPVQTATRDALTVSSSQMNARASEGGRLTKTAMGVNKMNALTPAPFVITAKMRSLAC
jgi:hypothetical protein